jgi:type II secretory pathway component PulF
MPLYRYTATNTAGEQVRGEATAASPGLLSLHLAASELKLVSAEPVMEFGRSVPSDTPPLSESQAAEVLEFVTETMKSRLPIGTSLRLFAADVPDRAISAAALKLAGRLDAGTPLPEALKSLRLPAGLASILTECRDADDLGIILSEHLSSEQPARSMRHLLRLRLAYTGLQFGVSMALLSTVAVIFGNLFRQVFDEFGSTPPFATRLVIEFANLLTTYWWAVLFGLLCAACGVFALVTTVILAPARDRLLSPFTYQIALGRMLRTLAVLLEHRRPLHDSIRVAADVSANTLIQKPAYVFAYTLEQGKPIGTAISAITGFPPEMFDGISYESHMKAAPDALRGMAEYHDNLGRARWVFFCFVIDVVVQIVTLLVFLALIFVVFMPLLYLLEGFS